MDPGPDCGRELGQKVLEQQKEIHPAIAGLDGAAHGQGQGGDVDRIGADHIPQSAIFESPGAGVTIARRTALAPARAREKNGVVAALEVVGHERLHSGYRVWIWDRVRLGRGERS